MEDVKPNTTLATNSVLVGLRLELPPKLSPLQHGEPKELDYAQSLASLGGPTGIGTSAARLASNLTVARETKPEPVAPDAAAAPSAPSAPEPGYTEREWGDGSAPPLYVPVTERVDDRLAEDVDARLFVWAEQCGFQDTQLAKIHKGGFGRLVMLTHAGCEDPDRLLIAAQMNAAWWAADDAYADDSDSGAIPERLPPRLSLAMAAMDPLPPMGEFTTPLDEALRNDPILVALRSGMDHMGQYGTPAQLQRVCYSTFSMFVSWTAYAAWRHTGKYPPAWEYLAARQHDSFYTSMTLIDILEGYELPASLFYEPNVRRAAFQAGTATVLVNDLHSVAKDAAEPKPVCNMVLQIAKDRSCSILEATEITVDLHNNLVREFEAGCKSLRTLPSLELHRFLHGLRAWMGGGFEWHATNPRYKTKPQP
jgi:2-methylisoborneol synthase